MDIYNPGKKIERKIAGNLNILSISAYGKRRYESSEACVKSEKIAGTTNTLLLPSTIIATRPYMRCDATLSGRSVLKISGSIINVLSSINCSNSPLSSK